MNNLISSKSKRLTALLLTSILSVFSAQIQAQKADNWVYKGLSIPQLSVKPKKAVTVAVVDDGFRFSHKSLDGFLYTNEKEVPDNFRDDDGNGYIDDIHGWDVADNDADVSIPKGREESFYHGTHIAGIITDVFRKLYGEGAKDYLKIIPIKSLSDFTQSTYLESGYKGIEYAVSLNPDVICCAWSGGELPKEVQALLNDAMNRGIIVIGSAGNFSTEKNEMPAAFPGVISVAAVDSSFSKHSASNYGMRVDFAAPGKNVYGAYSSADNAFFYSDGTSPATALMTGCIAGLKAYKLELSSDDLIKAISSTSTPVDEYNPRYAGKLGAGIPDIAEAIKFLDDKDHKYISKDIKNPKGNIFYKKKMTPESFYINPDGAYKGIHFFSSSPDYKGEVKLMAGDSVFYSGTIKDLNKGAFIPGSSLQVEIMSKSKSSKEMEFSYYVQTIDSTTLYCRDIQILTDTSGVVTDGSYDENYANFSSCKWQINVPEGKKVKIEFSEMDTQPNVDFVYIFDGTATLQKNMLAKFSGQNIPPTITSLSNQVLIWFVSDGFVTGKGWKLKYEPTEESIYF